MGSQSNDGTQQAAPSHSGNAIIVHKRQTAKIGKRPKGIHGLTAEHAVLEGLLVVRANLCDVARTEAIDLQGYIAPLGELRRPGILERAHPAATVQQDHGWKGAITRWLAEPSCKRNPWLGFKLDTLLFGLFDLEGVGGTLPLLKLTGSDANAED